MMGVIVAPELGKYQGLTRGQAANVTPWDVSHYLRKICPCFIFLITKKKSDQFSIQQPVSESSSPTAELYFQAAEQLKKK